jgi:hypothetical protein
MPGFIHSDLAQINKDLRLIYLGSKYDFLVQPERALQKERVEKD